MMKSASNDFRSPMNRGNSASIAKLALVVLLGGETILFGTLVSSYLFVRAEASVTPSYTQAGLERLWLPIINTLVLLLSAAAAGYAARSIKRGRRDAMQNGLTWSLMLGLMFVALQVIEFSKSGMSPLDAAFGGMYMALIGFHAVHVLAGVVLLGLNLLRARLGDFTEKSHTVIDVSAWFWYYVTAVWFVLFAVLYLL